MKFSKKFKDSIAYEENGYIDSTVCVRIDKNNQNLTINNYLTCHSFHLHNNPRLTGQEGEHWYKYL